jgi:putative methionine-R-sulfoxide reductase with GAF domain
MSLLGALLVSENLITRDQLVACLMLQREEASDLPLGQILLREGYITQDDLDRTLSLQQELRASLIDSIGSHQDVPSDLTALIIASRYRADLVRHMRLSGVQVRVLSSLDQIEECDLPTPAELILVDQYVLTDIAELPATSLVGLLPTHPEASISDMLSIGETQLIDSYIARARELTQLRSAPEVAERSTFQLQQFAAMSRRMLSDHAREDLLMQLMSFVRDTISVEAGTLYEIDPLTNQLVFAIVLGSHQAELESRRIPIDHGIAGWVASHCEPVLVADAQHDARFAQSIDQQTGFQTRSVLCVPIMIRDQVFGVIQLINKLGGAFTRHDMSLLQIAAMVGGLVYLSGERSRMSPA